MSLADRFQTLLSHVKKNPSQFAKSVGFKTPQTVREILKGNTKSVSEAVRLKISSNYPEININWLISGEGEMLRQDLSANAKLLGKPAIEIRENLIDVKFYQVTPTATFKDYCQGMQENPDYISILPISGETIDETSCVFEIHGDSMAPQIQDRAKVLCREIPPTRWHLLADCVVVIAYAEKFVIKRIAKNRLESENYLVLESDNPEVSESESVQLADIRCIFKAERIISQKIN